MLGSERMQKIMDQVALGIEPKSKESAEAAKFRAGVKKDIVNARKIAKKKKMDGFTVDYTPEFPTL